MLLLCLFTTMLFNCQKEDDLDNEAISQNNHVISNGDSTISMLRSKDIEKTPSLMRIIDKAEKKASANKTGKTVYNADYDFTINTSYAKVMENNGQKSYTFGVYRAEDNGLLENLLLEEQANDTFKVSLVQYDLTTSERNKLANREMIDVEEKITFMELEDISDTIFTKDNVETCPVMSYEYQQGNSCDSGQHEYSDGSACNYWGNPDLMATSGGYVLTASEVPCDQLDGGGSSPGDTGNPNGNPNGNQSGGYGSNGTDTNNDPNTTPVLCTDCPPIEEECPTPDGQLTNQLNSVLGEDNYSFDC